jgi:hypothetical protein
MGPRLTGPPHMQTTLLTAQHRLMGPPPMEITHLTATPPMEAMEAKPPCCPPCTSRPCCAISHCQLAQCPSSPAAVATQQAISILKLTAFGELQIQDSEVDRVSTVVASEMTNFGAIKVVRDIVMTSTATIRVANSIFQNGNCSKDCGALLIQNRDA